MPGGSIGTMTPSMNSDSGESHELVIAHIVSEFAEWGLGRRLGEPTLNDDGTSPAQFDVIFNDADPPVALEVTSITDGEFISTAAAAEPVAARLNAHAQRLGAGFWYINVVAGTLLKPLENELDQLMERGPEVLPDLMAQDGLRTGLPFGVTSVYLEATKQSGAVIGTWSGFGALPLAGFRSELWETMQSNAAKLAAVIGYERHLAVDLRAMRAADPGATPPPELPDSIDYLWVIRRTVTASRSQPIVWLTRSAEEWKTHGEPYE